VPRLTLLFFGGAEDVPEAAKMVTAGTACLHLAMPSSHAAAPEEVEQQRNDRDDQQNVNQPTSYVEREESQQPQYQQNHKQRQEHLKSPS